MVFKDWFKVKSNREPVFFSQSSAQEKADELLKKAFLAKLYNLVLICG